jgi:hypothetical protein
MTAELSQMRGRRRWDAEWRAVCLCGLVPRDAGGSGSGRKARGVAQQLVGSRPTGRYPTWERCGVA